MIEERNLQSWQEYKKTIADIRSRYGYQEVEVPNDTDLAKGANLPESRVYRRRNVVLFRGQNNAAWDIRTTLERKTECRPISISAYYSYVDHCVNEIESVTGRSWNLPAHDELRNAPNADSLRPHLLAYDYLVYLRHHGFPSPLLDWSESPYIAAFFAFWEKPQADRVAVLCYIESIHGGWSLSKGAPTISVRGPYVTTHKRHFAQKTWFTIATQWEEREKKHYFCPHEDVLRKPKPDQDILIKITLPAHTRKEAIRELLDYNINPFTLFQTEDSLIQTMELKQFDLDGDVKIEMQRGRKLV